MRLLLDIPEGVSSRRDKGHSFYKMENPSQQNVRFARPWEWAVCLLLIAAVLGVYGPVVGHDFINFDDPEYITENHRVRAGLTPGNLLWAMTATEHSNWHPLTWMSHMLDVDLFGIDPGMHHLVSVLIHSVNAVLIFYTLWKLTGGFWQSAFVAALFALHPLHVESVAWAAERKDLLSTFFGFAAIWRYSLYVSDPGIKKYAAVLFYFTLSLMSKPMLVTLPFLLLLLDRWPLQRIGPDAQRMLHLLGRYPPAVGLVAEKIPFFILSVLSCTVTLMAQQAGSAVMSLDRLPFYVRLAHTPIAYMGYIKKTIWPVDLGVFYPHPGISPGWAVACALLLIAAISFLAAVYRKSYPFFLIGWLWFLGLLVPVIGLVQVGSQGMADRYTYVPLTGIFIILTWGISAVTRRWRGRDLILSLFALAVVASCAVMSRQQVSYWSDSIALYQHALQVTSGNYSVHNNLGIAYENKGRLAEAAYHYTQSLEIKPDYDKAMGNLANVLMAQGKIFAAVALYRHALQIRPDSAKSHNNLAVALIRQGDLGQGVHHFKKALELDPEYAKAYYNYGNALANSGRTEDAIFHFKTAVRINPFFAKAYNNLGVALVLSGKPIEAIPHYGRALSITPEFAEAHNNLGIALVHAGEPEEAARYFQRAIALDPEFSDARANFERVRKLMAEQLNPSKAGN